MRFPLLPRSWKARALAGSIAFAMAGVALAIHPQNAGPESFTIKFKLPPPKPLTAEEEAQTFQLEPGFHAELVAAEPMVDTPVAMSWDEKGRLFVCEMRGYMHDVDGKGEDQPLGRIVTLEDTDGDGKMDKRTIFADELILPRAVLCTNGGVLVGEPPVLWFMKDTDGDGKADTKEIVDKNFGSRTGQPEHMVNSPIVAQDNWIYFANHHSRYRFKDGKWLSEAVPIRGQWGMTQDDYGRLLYNFNSDFLRATFVPEYLYLRNPNYPATAGASVQIQKDQTCWPSHPTPGVNRGYEAGALREDGTLKACTATCGAGIYRGALFPQEYRGNAFIPEPSGNLVKRLVIAEKNGELVSHNAYEGKEFWTSTDERFRPVNAYSGPDGALWVLDMYRGVIQHKGFLTHYLVQNIKDRELEQPIGMGRIWRIVPDQAKPAVGKVPTETAALVKALDHPDGWVRDQAQRILVERKDAATLPALAELLKSGSRIAKIHALWTLDGVGIPAPELVAAALQEADPKVRAVAVRVADRTMEPQLAQMVNDANVEVKVALAFALSGLPEAQEAVIALARTKPLDPRLRDGLVSGLRGRELEVLQAVLASKEGLRESLTLPANLNYETLKLENAKGQEKEAPKTDDFKNVEVKPETAKLDDGKAGETPGKVTESKPATKPAATPKPPAPSVSDNIVSALAQAVMNEKRSARVKQLLALIAAQEPNSPEQISLLIGTSGKIGKPVPKGKLLYLDSEAPEIAAMKEKANAKSKPLLAALDARVAWPNKPGVPPPPVIVPLTTEEQALFETGKTVYNTLCAACHQPTGLGMAGLAPALVDSDWVLGNAKALPRIVMHGLTGPISVNGQTWNLEMPPLGAALSDEQIAGVLTYIRREWEHGASPISLKLVQEIRQQHKDRTMGWNNDDLKAVLKEPAKGAPAKSPTEPAPKEASAAPQPAVAGSGQ